MKTKNVPLTKAQRYMVEENINLAYKLAWDLYKRCRVFPLEDVKQICCVGLCQAAAKYNPDVGTAFSTLAYVSMQRLFYHELRDKRQPEMVSLDQGCGDDEDPAMDFLMAKLCAENVLVTGKLTPYTVHGDWYEEVSWQPEEDGTVLNNDFYGGNFAGITEKLPYIASLGATILYLNPISKSFSSHRYDTGDYKTPDPMLGTEADFRLLCQTAHKLGAWWAWYLGWSGLYGVQNRRF